MTFFYISIHYIAMLTVFESGYYRYIFHPRFRETDAQNIDRKNRHSNDYSRKEEGLLQTPEAATIADCRRKMWAKSQKERIDCICRSIKHATGQSQKGRSMSKALQHVKRHGVQPMESRKQGI